MIGIYKVYYIITVVKYRQSSLLVASIQDSLKNLSYFKLRYGVSRTFLRVIFIKYYYQVFAEVARSNNNNTVGRFFYFNCASSSPCFTFFFLSFLRSNVGEKFIFVLEFFKTIVMQKLN